MQARTEHRIDGIKAYWTAHTLDWSALALIVALWLLANWHQLTPVRADQWSINNGDFVANNFIYSDFMARQIKQGHFPLWWPNLNAGRPFLADPQAGALYPFRLLAILLSGANWTYGTAQAEAILHLLIAGLLTYAAARVISGSVIGGLAAALVFAFGGLLNGGPLQQLQLLESVTWLPLVILAVHLAVNRGSLRWIVLAGVGMSLTILAGHDQVALMVGYLALIYLIYLAYCVRMRWTKVALYIVLMFGIAGGLAAAQLLPTFQLQSLSTRASDLTFATKSGGLTFGMLLQMIWPGIVAYFSPLYIGIPALALILVSLVFWRTSRPQNLFWIGAALGTGLLMLGGNTILFSVFYWLLPGVSLFRNQERTSLLFVFALAMLAATGTRLMLESTDHTRRRTLRIFSLILLSITGIVLIGIALGTFTGGPGSPVRYLDTVFYAFVVAAFAAIAVFQIQPSADSHQLLASSSGADIAPEVLDGPIVPSSVHSRNLWPVIALIALLGFDLLTFSSKNTAAFSPIPVDDRIQRPLYLANVAPGNYRIDGARALAPNSSLFKLNDVFGSSPLQLASISSLLTLPVDRYWDLLAVRYVISDHATLPVKSNVIDQGYDDQGKFYVHELANPRPYAWLVYAADINPDPVFARQILADPRFALRDKAILDQPPPLDLPGTRADNADAEIVSLEADTLQVKVDSSQNALLTLALPYYPGWQATVDGAPAPILKAYTALSAVPVTAGTHIVTLRFAPPLFQLGLLLSGITVLIAATIVIVNPLRKGA